MMMALRAERIHRSCLVAMPGGISGIFVASCLRGESGGIATGMELVG